MNESLKRQSIAQWRSKTTERTIQEWLASANNVLIHYFMDGPLLTVHGTFMNCHLHSGEVYKYSTTYIMISAVGLEPMHMQWVNTSAACVCAHAADKCV